MSKRLGGIIGCKDNFRFITNLKDFLPDHHHRRYLPIFDIIQKVRDTGFHLKVDEEQCLKKNQNAPVFVSHIQPIGCQPPKKLFYTVANPARGLLNRGK